MDHRLYYWICDPGHAWLVVPVDDLLSAGACITSYSYLSYDGATVYLEEDCDAPAFIAAACVPADTVGSWPVRYEEPQAHVRELSPYRAA